MDAPRVSVVFTNFNAGRTIEKCIQRALDQTIKPVEVLIVDAGSTDGCQEIARRYESQGVRLIVVDGIAPGPGEMLGAKEAKGDFLITTNPDVYTPHDWIEKSYKRWQEGYALVGGLRINGGDKFNMGWTVRPPKDLITTIQPELGITTMSMFFKKSLLDEVHMTNVLDSRDVELELRTINLGLKIVVDPDIRVIHDHRFGSAMKSFHRSASYVTRNISMVKAINGKVKLGTESGIHISYKRYISQFLLVDAWKTYTVYKPLLPEIGVKVSRAQFLWYKTVFNAGQIYGLFRAIFMRDSK